MDNITVICHHEMDRFLQDVNGFDVSTNPFQSFAFLSVFLKYNPKGNFYFFNIYENNSLFAIIPLECTVDSYIMRTKYFRFIGYRQLNYEQYICKDEDVVKVHNAFVDYMARQKYHSIINYYDINNTTELYRILSMQKRNIIGLSLYQCPYLYFTDSFDTFFKEVYSSSKKRSELKKFQNKLYDIGNFRIINISNQDSYLQNIGYLDQIYRVHAERFAKVYATSFFGSPKMRPYYSDLIASLMRDKKGFISLMLMDETVIAFIFCLTNGKTLIDWIPAFDPAFTKYSLGIVQYKLLFEEMCTPSQTYKIFDYSKGSSVYKRKWAKKETINYQFIVQTSKQNIFSSVLYIFETNKFSFKCYLREKGILEWIKNTLGSFLSLFKKTDTQKTCFSIEFVEEEARPFTYTDFINYPVELRRAILEELYQGCHFVSVTNNTDSLIIKMTK